VATVLFFGPARDAVGQSRAIVEGARVDEVVAAAVARYGERLASLLPTCRVWLNGEMATLDSPVSADDELAVLPPVSGG
jgi:molybdopterin converting factor small subunit